MGRDLAADANLNCLSSHSQLAHSSAHPSRQSACSQDATHHAHVPEPIRVVLASHEHTGTRLVDFDRRHLHWGCCCG